jgi:AraC-like DNA-binding protein
MSGMTKMSFRIRGMRLVSDENDVRARPAVEASVTVVPYPAILEHIRQNVSRRIGVDELAAIACISVFELCRAFRRERATTPYRLVLDVRLRHASVLLGAGATIAETAVQTGFADQSHFTRHFKRLTGMTPRQYATSRRDAALPAAPGHTAGLDGSL